MYGVHIGKRFLNLYNKRSGTTYSPREFFDEIFYPKIFGNDLFLTLPANSIFFDQFLKFGKVNKSSITESEKIIQRDTIRKKKLEEFYESVDKFGRNEIRPNAIFVPGFEAAAEPKDDFSQTTDMKIQLTVDEIYYNWIGLCLAIGVAGGINLYIEDDTILWFLFEGWDYYRNVIIELEGDIDISKKIDSWNGIWLFYRLNQTNAIDSIQNLIVGEHIDKKSASPILRPTWIQIALMLAKQKEFQNRSYLLYAFSFGQQNTTLGFATLNIPSVKSTYDYQEILFGESDSSLKLEEVWEGKMGIREAIKFGSIGIRQLEPKSIREYMTSSSNYDYSKAKTADKKLLENLELYTIWLCAMINKETILAQCQATAVLLSEFEKSVSGGKTTYKNIVEEVLTAKSKQKFIESLTEIVKQPIGSAEEYDRLVNEVHLNLPNDYFQYFITLIKFKYYSLQKKA